MPRANRIGKQIAERSALSKIDRLPKQGRVITVNRLNNTCVIDVGQRTADTGLPVYMQSVPYMSQTPPTENSFVSLAYRGNDPHSTYIASSGLGGSNATGTQTVVGGSIEVAEVDGSPDNTATKKLVFPNGTLSGSGNTVIYTPAGGGMTDPETTAGDMIFHNAANALARLPVGNVGMVLRSRGATPIPTWEYMDESISFDLSTGTIKNHSGTVATAYNMNTINSLFQGNAIKFPEGGDNSYHTRWFGSHRYFFTGYTPVLIIQYFNPSLVGSIGIGPFAVKWSLYIEAFGAGDSIIAGTLESSANTVTQTEPGAQVVQVATFNLTNLSPMDFSKAVQFRLRRNSGDAADTSTVDFVVPAMEVVFQRQ